MKGKTLGLLAVGTLLLSTCAGMTLSAKDLESMPKGESSPVSEKPKERPHMDLAFCIDTTGSMQAEIDMVKTKVKELVAKLCAGKPAPIVRVGLVAYRDRGDAYVTKVYPFSDDVDQFVKDISNLQANGGGDGPEAVNEALHASVSGLEWDKSNKTAKLLFLIGDASPHYYANDYKWEDESKSAIAKGIQINTLGCNGLESDGDGVRVFEQIAKLADGTYETLAYRQIVKDASGKETTIISSGGAAFEVSAGARDEWKKGASILARVGKAKPVAAASPAASPLASESMLMYGGTAAGGKGFASMSGTMSRRASMSMDRASMPAGVNRKDSNLDSLMYDAAMKKAKEKLKVDY